MFPSRCPVNTMYTRTAECEICWIRFLFIKFTFCFLYPSYTYIRISRSFPCFVFFLFTGGEQNINKCLHALLTQQMIPAPNRRNERKREINRSLSLSHTHANRYNVFISQQSPLPSRYNLHKQLVLNHSPQTHTTMTKFVTTSVILLQLLTLPAHPAAH